MTISIENNSRFLRYLMACSEAFVTMSVLVVFFGHKGVSFSEFLMIQAIFSIVSLIVEIPSGYLSDRFSRRMVLIAGASTILLGHSLVLAGYGFWDIVIAEVFLGIGRSLISGTASALLFDSLLSLGKEDSYNEEEGRVKSWMAYSLAGAGLLGSLLFTTHPNLPQLLTCIMMVAAVYFAFQLKDPPKHTERERKTPWQDMKDFTHYALRGHEELPWIIIFSGVICSATMLGTWLSQPYWEQIGAPVWLFGLLFFLQQAARGFSLAKSDFILKKFSTNALIIAMFGFIVAGFALQALITSPIGFLLTLIPAVVFGITHILVLGLINNRVESAMRATILSIESLAWRIIFSISGMLMGAFHDTDSPATTFTVCAIAWLLMGIVPTYKLVKKNL